MKKLMKRFLITMCCLLIIFFIITCCVERTLDTDVNTLKNSKEMLKVQSKVTKVINKEIKSNLLKEETISFKNCDYEFTDEDTLKITKYLGDSDSVIIPDKIEGNVVEQISQNAFKNTKNLELIKISKKIGNDKFEILDFEKNEELSDNNYIAYTTTKEYNENYLKYLDFDQELKNRIRAVPSKLIESNDSDIELVFAGPETSTPEKFDLRDMMTIQVEDQGDLGICYAYAAMKSVETNIALRYHIVNNFSEIHAAVLSEQGYSGYLGTVYDKYFKTGYGPINESVLSKEKVIKGYKKGDTINKIIYNYCVNNKITQKQLNKVLKNLKQNRTEPEYYVMSIEDISLPLSSSASKGNIEDIKEQIIKNGSVSATVVDPHEQKLCKKYNGKTVMNALSKYSPYRNEYEPSNQGYHEISIIGWNDNFSRLDFPEEFRPQNDGAFLALNSFGSQWGDNGCFWISYEDSMVYTNLNVVTEVNKGKVDINKAIIDPGTFKNEYKYTGHEIKQSIDLIYNGQILNNCLGEDDLGDYKIEYTNNIKPGTATMKIIGTGRFTGSITKTFKINGKGIEKAKITLSNTSFEYNGKAKKPTATVKLGKKTLKQNDDYKLSYSNNINAGDATIIITGKGMYEGKATASFKITPKSIAKFEVDKIPAQEQTENSIEPSVTIKDGSKILTKDVDYSLSYKNNKDVGTATVTITGKGNYKGTNKVKFEILLSAVKGLIATDTEANSITLKWDKNENATGYEIYMSTSKDGNYSKIKTISKNTTVTFKKSKLEEGKKYYFKIRAYKTINSKNEYGAYSNILKASTLKSIESATVSEIANQTYTGKEIKPSITIKYEKTKLKEGTDYTLSYQNNVKKGTATIVITGNGEYAGTMKKTFKIVKK